MGHSYGRTPAGGRGLACDNCGKVGKVRKRTCPQTVTQGGQTLPYCVPPALCPGCWTAEKSTVHADCEAGAARLQAQHDAEQAAAQTCEHRTGQPGCALRACQGVPLAPVTLDRNVVTATEEPTEHETGAVACGRSLVVAVRELTGAPVTLPRFGDNGWSDTRPGARELYGWDFVAAGCNVRVLRYESRQPFLPGPRLYAAMYFDSAMVAGAVELDRAQPQWIGEIARLLVPHIERAADAAALAAPCPAGGRRLKCPPEGSVVESPDGLATVLEARVGGAVLVARGHDGHERYLDRPTGSGWWTVYPAGHEPTARQQWETRRDAFLAQVTLRHSEYGHTGPEAECGACNGEVAGQPDHNGHQWGRWVPFPWCLHCGAPAQTEQLRGRCPGAPRVEVEPMPVDRSAVDLGRVVGYVDSHGYLRCRPCADKGGVYGTPVRADQDNGARACEGCFGGLTIETDRAQRERDAIESSPADAPAPSPSGLRTRDPWSALLA